MDFQADQPFGFIFSASSTGLWLRSPPAYVGEGRQLHDTAYDLCHKCHDNGRARSEANALRRYKRTDRHTPVPVLGKSRPHFGLKMDPGVLELYIVGGNNFCHAYRLSAPIGSRVDGCQVGGSTKKHCEVTRRGFSTRNVSQVHRCRSLGDACFYCFRDVVSPGAEAGSRRCEP